MRNISELVDFLNNTMSMTDVYQPAVILHLLERGGTSTKSELSRTLSGYDNDVQEYFEKVLMRWPKITLTKHNVVRYNSAGAIFSLNFDLGEEKIVEQAKEICEQKIRGWITKRGIRRNSSGTGASVRYRVLKAARGKCELCGISSKIAQIDIDHIVPRNLADKYGYVLKDNLRIPVDDERNLQSLCFKCNRAKRDQDTTDFRLVKSRFIREHVSTYTVSAQEEQTTHQLTTPQLIDELFEKLVEEHARLIDRDGDEPVVERIVDMMEVLVSIAKVKGQTEEGILALMRQRRDEFGGFNVGGHSFDDVA